jgi:hypothetical protein
MTSDAHVEHWQRELAHADQVQRDTVVVIYQAANARIAGLETKAIGLFAVVGVVTAGDFVACTGAIPAAVMGLIGLTYAIFAIAACCLVIVPRGRQTLLLEDSGSPTGGVAEMAAVTRMLEPINIRVSNLVTSAIYDAIRAATLTFVALLVFVAWHP